MALSDRVQNALNESRTLVLGVQVLLGFEYRAFFERAFASLPPVAQWAKLAALLLSLATLALLMTPSARHRLVEHGRDSSAVVDFAQRLAALALVPFAAALALELYVAASRSGAATAAALAAAGATFLVAVLVWFALPLAERQRVSSPPVDQAEKEDAKMQPTKLTNKVEHVLTETRVVLPGTQALLAFQLATILLDTFPKLPPALRAMHLIALGFTVISVVALMAPAPFHRIVEQGQATDRFHRFASNAVLTGMLALAASLAADLFVVVAWFARSSAAGAAAAILAFAALFTTWYVLPIGLRHRRAA